MSDVTKFVAGSLQALSAMVLLELPHINMLTKVDLLTPESKVHPSALNLSRRLKPSHSLSLSVRCRTRKTASAAWQKGLRGF